MGLNYICSNSTYDLTGSEYTTVFDKKKRLNYIVSGTINQLGLTTDTTASVYSPLKFKLSGDDYYIGRSTTFNTTSSTNTLTTRTATDYYTLYTATSSGSSNGSNSNMTSTSQYLYSTQVKWNGGINHNTVSFKYTSSINYSFSGSSSANTSNHADVVWINNSNITVQFRKGYISSKSSVIGTSTSKTNENGNHVGVIGSTTSYNSTYYNKTSTSTNDGGVPSPGEYGKYTVYSTKSYRSTATVWGSTSNVEYIYGTGVITSNVTVVTNRSTGSTYSTRYTSTYTGTISGVYLAATSTKLTYSTREYYYNTSISITTIDSSHNFV